jgi:hypothetical protein
MHERHSGDRQSISIDAPTALLADPVARSAIDDTHALLQQGFPEWRITLNDRSARIHLVLPVLTGTTPPSASVRAYPNLAYPQHDYRWSSLSSSGRLRLELRTSSPQGVSCALYGLLQEKLGYRFFHPRRSLIPHHRRWPLPASFRFEATPRFDKKGFHLHTLHPIELAEQLNNPAMPNALDDVKEYIDWLARNQQNVMQFYLLREVDRRAWIRHAGEIVAYAHRRGVRAGVQISLAMLQQQAFQAITLGQPYPSYKRQIDATLAWLFQVPWDFLTLESAMGEYLPQLGGLLPELKNHLVREVTGRYHSRLLLATHVIRERTEREREAAPDRAPTDGVGSEAGVLIHTVMCYSASEPRAPVYGNRNQRFMLAMAEREKTCRETWYWPESAYWVAFDNAVPLFLLPYLQSRWDDMATMERLGVDGHLTFTSGWEWGYWLTDRSIARWSWRYRDNGKLRPAGPLSRLKDLFPDRRVTKLWQKSLDLQQLYLKEHDLMKYLAALAPFSEMPYPLDQPFQPEPDFTSSWLLHEAGPADVAHLERGVVADLHRFAVRMESVAGELEQEQERFLAAGGRDREGLRPLAAELVRGLRITALRARHRELTLQALIADRHHGLRVALNPAAAKLVAKAAGVRLEALPLVREQEAGYRYPLTLLARPRPSLTAYRFGYLYPASELFFWRREEEQVRQERFDPLFMNLWDFWRTLGLGSIFF